MKKQGEVFVEVPSYFGDVLKQLIHFLFQWIFLKQDLFLKITFLASTSKTDYYLINNSWNSKRSNPETTCV